MCSRIAGRRGELLNQLPEKDGFGQCWQSLALLNCASLCALPRKSPAERLCLSFVLLEEAMLPLTVKMVPQRWPVKSVSSTNEIEHPATAMEEGLV